MSATDTATERPYTVVVHVGPAPAVEPGVRLADLTIDSDARDTPASLEHPTIVRLAASGLTPADLRARVLFAVDRSVRAADAVAGYAALTAFAGRRIDLTCAGTTVDLPALHAHTRSVADAGRPDLAVDLLQVGAGHPSVPAVGTDGKMTAADVSLVKAARRVRLVPVTEPATAVTQFTVIAALRVRGETDRFPILVHGDEPADDADTTAGVDLDELRRAAVELRRGRRGEDRSAVVEPATPTERQLHLQAAAATPVPAVMVALGATTSGGGVWHCPRPERHSHGDAVPSMRVEAHIARCYRCDPEKVDPVRLVADVKQCSLDEAADWIVAVVAPRTAELTDGLPDDAVVTDDPPVG